jgi:hypothetical protein
MGKIAGYSCRLTVVAVFAAISGAAPAFAAADISEISQNIVTSGSNLPGLIAAISYMLALLFGAAGVLKLKEHVENPNQVPLREPLVRLIAGGALLALPAIYDVMRNTIGNGTDFNTTWAGLTMITGLYSGALGWLSGFLSFGNLSLLSNANGIMGIIIKSLQNVPGLISAVAYLLGLVMGVTAILKTKEHIENPNQTALREGVIRFLIGGSLLALPMVIAAAHNTIANAGSVQGAVSGILGGMGLFYSSQAAAVGCIPGQSTANGAIGAVNGGIGVINGILGAVGLGGIPTIGALGGGPTIGTIMCNTVENTAAAQAFLTAIAYLFAIVLIVWGLLKIKDHVLEPRQTTVWEGVSRLLAGGAFLALPAVMTAVYNTISIITVGSFTGSGNSGFTGQASTGGLDTVMVAFMTNILGPMNVVLNFFGMVAGMILIMIGISRLIKSAQEGTRGPGGLGTMMTFLMGGALMSFSPMMTAFNGTLFNDTSTNTMAALSYTTGMQQAEVDHAHAVISSVLKFMIILGLISFIRGLFIIRGVAEGNSQASMMAGVTHLVGGALAVNLGPLMNAVQATLGLTQYGVVFS